MLCYDNRYQQEKRLIGCTLCLATALFRGDFDAALFLLSLKDREFPDVFYQPAQDFDFLEKYAFADNRIVEKGKIPVVLLECDHIKIDIEEHEKKCHTYDTMYVESPFRIESLTRLVIKLEKKEAFRILLEKGHIYPLKAITFEEVLKTGRYSILVPTESSPLGPLRNILNKRSNIPVIKYVLEQEKYEFIPMFINYGQLDPNLSLGHSPVNYTDCLSDIDGLSFIIKSTWLHFNTARTVRKFEEIFEQLVLLGFEISKEVYITRLFMFYNANPFVFGLLTELLIENGLEDFTLHSKVHFWVESGVRNLHSKVHYLVKPVIPNLIHSSFLLWFLRGMSSIADADKITIKKILSLGYGHGGSFVNMHSDLVFSI